MEKIASVSLSLEEKENKASDLEEALQIAGIGYYNIKYSILLALFLIASIVEVIGYSYVLPAAKCDLGMSDSQRGVIASLPYVGMVVTSFPWGYIVDTRGRKRTLVISSFVVGCFSSLSAFMPNLASFAVCKGIANLFLACPSAVPYAFIGEIVPQKHRDIALSLTNALQMLGAGMVPLIAWGILPLDINTNFGAYYFRSWRLLTIIYSSLFIICSVLMLFGPESPKFLLAQGKTEEALDVLRKIYAVNNRKSTSDYPVQKLKMPQDINTSKNFLLSLKLQTLPVLRPPYAKWLALNGFLLFGIFSCLNGLFMWVPDVLNRVFSGSDTDGLTACAVIKQRFNETIIVTECDDSIDTSIYSLNSSANLISAFIVVACSASIKVIGKKVLVILMFGILGIFCISINFITNSLIFAVLLMSLQITAVGIGPINAFVVEIFPTHLRGMAVSLSLMCGRFGSAVMTNVAGLLINKNCESLFYSFGGLLLVCGLLSLLLPSARRIST